jgi:hypothetical protein
VERVDQLSRCVCVCVCVCVRVCVCVCVFVQCLIAAVSRIPQSLPPQRQGEGLRGSRSYCLMHCGLTLQTTGRIDWWVWASKRVCSTDCGWAEGALGGRRSGLKHGAGYAAAADDDAGAEHAAAADEHDGAEHAAAA